MNEQTFTEVDVLLLEAVNVFSFICRRSAFKKIDDEFIALWTKTAILVDF